MGLGRGSRSRTWTDRMERPGHSSAAGQFWGTDKCQDSFGGMQGRAPQSTLSLTILLTTNKEPF